MRRAARSAAVGSAGLAGLAVVLAASGWLYLLAVRPRPSARAGPADRRRASARRAVQALGASPLVALRRRSGASPGSLLGLLARVRPRRAADRRRCCSRSAVGALGLPRERRRRSSIVRQIPAHDAFRAPRRRCRRSTSPPRSRGSAAPCSAGRAASSRPRAPIVLACFVGAAGAARRAGRHPAGARRALLSSSSRRSPCTRSPWRSSRRSALALIVLVARGLARSKRRAWQLAVGLLCGLGRPARLARLRPRRARRRAGRDRARRPPAGLRRPRRPGRPAARRCVQAAVLRVASIYAYGAAALWVNRIMADQPYTLGVRAARDDAARSSGSRHPRLGAPRRRRSARGSRSRCFSLGARRRGLAARRVARAVALPRTRRRRTSGSSPARSSPPGARTRSRRSCCARTSRTSSRGRAGVPRVPGRRRRRDRLRRPDRPARRARRRSSRAFVAFAHDRDWRIAILGASERCLDALPRARPARALPRRRGGARRRRRSRWTAAPIRKVRQSVHRLEQGRLPRPRCCRRARSAPELRARAGGGRARRGAAAAAEPRLRDGARRAVPARGRGRALRRRLRPRRRTPRASSTSPSREPGRRAVALVDAAAARRRRTGSTSGSSARPSSGRGRTAFERISLNFAPFAALLAPEAELTALQRLERQRAARAQGALPARQPARSSTASSSRAGSGGSSSTSGGATCRAWGSRRSPPRRTCRSAAASRGVSAGRSGSLLALGSAAALNWGYFAQHDGASAAAAALAAAAGARRCGRSSATPRWLAASSPGSAAGCSTSCALQLAPLSLVQAASAGGIGVLALLVARTAAPRSSAPRAGGVGVSLAGLVLLGDLARRLATAERARQASTAVVGLWIGVLRRRPPLLAAGPGSRLLAGGAGLGAAGGVLYAAGDVATKAAVGGGARLCVRRPPLLACHGVAFVALQLGFQRGGALATAGVATLLTNALPIVAGTLLFREGLPGGAAGVARSSRSPPSSPAPRCWRRPTRPQAEPTAVPAGLADPRSGDERLGEAVRRLVHHVAVDERRPLARREDRGAPARALPATA